MNILVVEDHSGICFALELLFELEGHLCVAVDRGELGLERLMRERFDAVLLDLNTNGIPPDVFMTELAGICDQQEQPRPRVGVLSASDTIEKEARRIGADFYLRKPFEHEDLMELLSAGDSWVSSPAGALSGSARSCCGQQDREVNALSRPS